VDIEPVQSALESFSTNSQKVKLKVKSCLDRLSKIKYEIFVIFLFQKMKTNSFLIFSIIKCEGAA
jgi:hypothetical protein